MPPESAYVIGVPAKPVAVKFADAVNAVPVTPVTVCVDGAIAGVIDTTSIDTVAVAVSPFTFEARTK